MTEVTVVIPSYRRGARIGPTLDSVLGQVDVDLDVLVIDDQSGPDHLAALHGATADVRVLEQPINGGPSVARQRGTDAATGRVVAYLDDDDLWEPDHLRRALDAMRAAQSPWAYGGVTYVAADGDVLWEAPLVPPGSVRERLREGNVLHTPSALVAERRLVLQLGGWDTALPALADWDMGLRLAAAAPPATGGTRTVRYVKHATSMSQENLTKVSTEFSAFRRKHEGPAATRGAGIGRHEFHRWMGYEHRAAGHRVSAASHFLRAARHGALRDNVSQAARALVRPRSSA